MLYDNNRRTMIKEDYVSFEISKLLKEKGFNEQCRDFYVQENGNWLHKNTYEYNYFNLQMPRWEDCYACPTLAMAMKWLREEKGIAVVPILSSVLDNERFLWDIEITNAKTNETYHQGWIYESYERACEAAIKYTIENLI